MLKSGRNLALITIIRTSRVSPGEPGFKLIVSDDGSLYGTVGSGALEDQAVEEARTMERDKIIIVNLSGRGDKDCPQAARILEVDE